MMHNIYCCISTLVIIAASMGALPAVAIDWASFDFSAKYDEPPIAVITVQPEFPEGAVVDSTGELLLAVLVDIEGKVDDVVMLEDNISPEVTDAVVEAVMQNRYEPAKFHGKPVEVWYMISVPVTPPRNDTEPKTNPSSIGPKGLERK